MRTSLNDIALIEGYLGKDLAAAEYAVVQDRLRHDFPFRMNLFLQRKVHALLKRHFRNQIRSHAETVHMKLFNDPSKKQFCETIYQLFEKH